MRFALNIGLVLAAFLASAGAVFASDLDAQIDRYFKACDESQTTATINNCLGKQYALADAELNRVWRQVKTKIEKSSDMPTSVRNEWRHNFIEGQRFWIRYKEAECRGSAPYKYWQGTLASAESLGCFLRLTIIRTSDLKDYLGN
jgi:uncharacterized protein YecT (DUF1311 family)